jgi:hypothetical protein
MPTSFYLRGRRNAVLQVEFGRHNWFLLTRFEISFICGAKWAQMKYLSTDRVGRTAATHCRLSSNRGGYVMRLLLVVILFLSGCGSESGPNGSSAGIGGTNSTGPSSGGNTAASTASGGAANATTSVIADGGSRYFEDAHSGNFWIGPVDYAETQWHNACAPSVKYPSAIQTLYGNNIMGLANEVVLQGLTASDGQLCDVCAELTANGRTLVAHVVTYGQETGPNDIDVSPEIDSALNGASNRTLTWRFITCPTTAPIYYTFDGRQWSNTWFFRVWIRNSRVPISKLEYRVGSATWATAEWQTDGAWQAANQDFSGGFSLRATSIEGQTLEDSIPGLNTFDPNVGIASKSNFK